MRLEEYLAATGVSAERFAADAKLAPRTVRNLLSGRWISMRNACKVRDATHGAVTLDEMVAPGGAPILGGSDAPEDDGGRVA